ncbi:MAG TPA: acyltransferase family protein [Acidimicrobiales bacterium]
MELETQVEPARGVPKLPHVLGLDGLRALAVLSVMAYHNGFAWLPGGFYGVDAFFVLSGYLITSLLVVEWRGTGTVHLGHFWARRARRLLPALFVLVAVLALLHLLGPGVLPWPDPLPDAAATLGYVANWHFVMANAGYFAASGPQSPLLHTWSLAIEEQFYLLWPLALCLVLGALTRVVRRPADPSERRRRLQWLGVFCVVGALASAGWMWLLTPAFANLNRAYYGTDTRAQALLVGAALAALLAVVPAPTTRVRRGAGMVAGAGLLGAALLWHLVPFYSNLAFHGGFLLASLASAAVMAGVVLAPAGVVSRALSIRPLRYVGRISYGAYLWHWPVTLVITAERTHWNVWALFAARASVTLAIAAASAAFIELPIRRGFLSRRRALVGAPVAIGLSLTLLAVAPTPVPVATLPVRTVDAPKFHIPAIARVRVLLVGDSMAGSLGAALAPEAPGYGVQIINEGHPGCAVTTDSDFHLLLFSAPPGKPCQIGQPGALLDKWRQWVDQYRPDVVVYLARTDILDQNFDGTWTSIGNPAFDRFLHSQLSKGLSILGRRGARVVLMTSPYYDSTVQAGGSVPEDTPGRVIADDQILEQVAKATPGVTVFPLGNVLTPDDHYQQDVNGVDVRCADGVHVSAVAGRVVAPRLFPLLLHLGHAAHVAAATDPPPIPRAVPLWYAKLQCGP